MALTIEEVGGLDKIDALQTHANHQVYELAVKILERYFDAVDEDEEFHPLAGADAGEAPEAPAQPFHYGGGFNFGGDYGGDDEDEEFHPVAGAGAGEAPAQP